jgi:hypothetical protein
VTLPEKGDTAEKPPTKGKERTMYMDMNGMLLPQQKKVCFFLGFFHGGIIVLQPQLSQVITSDLVR